MIFLDAYTILHLVNFVIFDESIKIIPKAYDIKNITFLNNSYTANI